VSLFYSLLQLNRHNFHSKKSGLETPENRAFQGAKNRQKGHTEKNLKTNQKQGKNTANFRLFFQHFPR
jgi:hypothetical protein